LSAVRTALNLAALYARVSAPVLPFTAETLAEALGEGYPPTWPGTDIAAELLRLPAGRKVTTPPVLFRKIDDAQIADWSAKFAGKDGG
jgi:methionyl-tRNA synthetase